MARRVDRTRVAEAFELAGCGWVLKRSDRDAVVEGASRAIGEFMDAYGKRFGETPDPFSLLTENPAKAAAFFQSFAGPPPSLGMRMTIWRILMGADIEALRLDYQKNDNIQIFIQTKFDYENNSCDCETTNPWDFRVVANIGLILVNEKPYLDGFYARRREG
jgi:hypothetical protein